ncbi:MAG: metallophosphoesterase [Acidaminococcaceae bacterium]|nr:metallophosphoesterase [Acidaminococcaceae bacterium]MDD4722979.1 metallophosphoesterase [Acidaminococcaceae bacterium]
MSIYAIGDLHFSGTPPTKPMNIFGNNWENHREKILAAWTNFVQADDTVLLCGDTSWAMDLTTAMDNDLSTIIKMPGKKILLKGNHDYWWTSLKKMKILTENKIFFLQNDFFPDSNIAICGTRGWNLPLTENFSIEDTLILKRECGRLETSLQKAIANHYTKIVVGLHYPPLYKNMVSSAFTKIMEKYKVEQCVFGHIHGADAASVFQGEKNGITYKLVAADYTNFQLVKLT